MSVEVRRLSNGLTVATETLPSIEIASRSASGSKSGARNERDGRARHGPPARAHGVQGHRTGAPPARSPAEIEDVGGEINAATSVETTSYYARVLERRRAAGARHPGRHPARTPNSTRRSSSASSTSSCRRSAPRTTRPTTSSSTASPRRAFRHQTIGRSILGTPETVESFTSKQLHDFIERQYGAERMVIVAAGDIEHDDFVREVEKQLRRLPPQGRRHHRRNTRIMSAAISARTAT